MPIKTKQLTLKQLGCGPSLVRFFFSSEHHSTELWIHRQNMLYADIQLLWWLNSEEKVI